MTASLPTIYGPWGTPGPHPRAHPMVEAVAARAIQKYPVPPNQLAICHHVSIIGASCLEFSVLKNLVAGQRLAKWTTYGPIPHLLGLRSVMQTWSILLLDQALDAHLPKPLHIPKNLHAFDTQLHNAIHKGYSYNLLTTMGKAFPRLQGSLNDTVLRRILHRPGIYNHLENFEFNHALETTSQNLKNRHAHFALAQKELEAFALVIEALRQEVTICTALTPRPNLTEENPDAPRFVPYNQPDNVPFTTL